jgi:hypothetical protein
MTKLTLTYVGRFAKTSKAGKPYTSLSLKANEYGDRYISGFGSKENADWKEGDTVEVDIETKGDYLNFATPKATFAKTGASFQPQPDQLRVERKLDAILTELQTMKPVLSDILSRVDKDLGEF